MLKLLFLTVLPFSIFISCQSCKDESLGTLDLDDSSIKYLDLNGTENLIFKNNSNDTIIFTGKKHTTTNRIFRGRNCNHREFGADGNYSTYYYSDGTPIIYRYENKSYSTLHFAFSIQSSTYPNDIFYDFLYIDLFDDKLSENIINSNIYAQIERDSSTGVKKVLSSRGFDKYLDGSFYNELINISQDSIKELTLLKKAYKNVTYNYTADGRKLYFAQPIGIVGFEDKNGDLWVFERKE